MPWSANDYPTAMNSLSPEVRRKAIEIANAILKETGDEGKAIATGIAKAKELKGKKGSAQGENMALIGALAPEGEEDETQQTVSAPTGGPHAFAATAAEVDPSPASMTQDPEDPTLHIFGYGVMRRSQIEKGVLERLEEIVRRGREGDWANAIYLFKNGIPAAMMDALAQHRQTGVWYDPEAGRNKKLTVVPKDL